MRWTYPYHETGCFIHESIHEPIHGLITNGDTAMDRELLAVATAILNEQGWSALSLDAIAARAGVSRATVWRHGLTRGAVELQLRRQLVADYRDLLWGPLTAAGPGADRLAAALAALCAVAERNLPFLAHTETALHGADLDAA